MSLAKNYLVRLSACQMYTAQIEVCARNAREAKKAALSMAEAGAIQWELFPDDATMEVQIDDVELIGEEAEPAGCD